MLKRGGVQLTSQINNSKTRMRTVALFVEYTFERLKRLGGSERML